MKKKFRNKTILVTAVLTVLSCILIVLFYRALSYQLFDERSNNLNHLSEKIGENFNILIECRWHKVSSSANALKKFSLESEDDLSSTAHRIEQLFGYDADSIALIDSNGFCYHSSGEPIRWQNIKSLSADAPKDQVLLTELSVLESRNEHIMFLRRLDKPRQLSDSEAKITHIVLIEEMKAFRKILTLSDSYDYGGSTYIADQNGTVIYHQSYSNNSDNVYNVLTQFRNAKFLYGSSYKKLCNEIENGKSDTIELNYKDRHWFLSYRNMEMNNWYIFQLAPSKAINGGSRSHTAMVLFYIIIIACILCFLIVYNVVSSMRQKLRREEAAKTAMQAMAEEAHQANQAKTDFLSNVSHDIRTPINGIIGMTEIAKRNASNSGKVQDCLEKISVASEHLLSLINDTLDMSRIEKGKINIAQNPFNLTTLLNDCATLVNNALGKHDIEFICNYDNLPHVHLLGDEKHIRQVLINILGNSIKFTPDGGKMALDVIETKAENGRAYYRFICWDTGIGMSEEFQQKIFDPFEQEQQDARSSHKGTGLGMTIVRNLVDLMNGHMEFSSRLGQGTTFTLYFDFEIDTPQPEKQEQTENATLAGMRILLAEDNDLNREIAEDILGDEGISITGVTNGREALETFRSNPPGTFDAILMDIMMPEMDGLEATRAIRSLDREDSKTIPILAMTANVSDEDIIKTKEAGMNRHLCKPLDLKLMIEALSEYYSDYRRNI